MTSIGSYAFSGCYALTSVTIPSCVKSIGDYTFSNCEALSNVTIPDCVTNVGKFVFSYCSTLTNATIGSGVKNIGPKAFNNCSALTSVTIGSGVTNIGEEAFVYCSALKRVTIPDGVTSIGENAFACCGELTSVTIGNGVTNIGDCAFCGRSALKVVTIPSSVANIRNSAFDGCRALKSVRVEAGDANRVKKMLANSGFKVKGIAFVNVGTCTVTLDANGGIMEAGTTGLPCPIMNISVFKDVAIDTSIDMLPVPVREGCVFAGWWTAKTKGSRVTASTKVKKNVTCYARWTNRKYKVATSVSSKSAGTVIGAGTKAFNSKVTLKATPKKGYVFVKWENLNVPDMPWPSAEKCRQPSVSFKQGAGAVSVKAVFARTTEDNAISLTVDPKETWFIDADPGRAIYVVADSLSYPSVSVKGQPAGMGLVRIAGTDCQYGLKVTDSSKLKPRVYTVKITAKNRAGKNVAKSVRIVAPNSTAAIAKGLIAGLETSTLSPYIVVGGIKVKWTLADLGVEVFATNGWKLASVTGLPTGLSWNGSAIVGVASKTGEFTVTFTLKRTETDGRKTKTYSSAATATFKVEALLPAALNGTYNGLANTSFVVPDDEYEGEGDGDDEEKYCLYTPLADGWASAAKVTVAAAGKITAKVGGVTLSGAGFDGVSNGVYVVTLKKTQKITKDSLKGRTGVWELYLEIDTNAAWDAAQLVGRYSAYTTGFRA